MKKLATTLCPIIPTCLLFLVMASLMIGCGNTKKNDVKSNIENDSIILSKKKQMAGKINLQHITEADFELTQRVICDSLVKERKYARPTCNEMKIDCASYPKLKKMLVFPDGTTLTTIPLPISLDRYMKDCNSYPSYQPADSLLSFLEKIEFEGTEYQCYLLSFKSKNIVPILLWVCRGDSEYYLIVTVAVVQEKIIDYLPIGESTDNSVISFFIDENFNITQYQARIVYSESNKAYEIINKKTLTSYQINDDGKIRGKSTSVN